MLARSRTEVLVGMTITTMSTVALVAASAANSSIYRHNPPQQHHRHRLPWDTDWTECSDDGHSSAEWPLPYSGVCAPFDSCGNHRYYATWDAETTASSDKLPTALRVRLEWRRPWWGPAPSVVLAQLMYPKPGAAEMIQNVIVHGAATRTMGDVIFDPSNASIPGVLLYFLPFSDGHKPHNGGNVTVTYDLESTERCHLLDGCQHDRNTTNGPAVDPQWRVSVVKYFAMLPQLTTLSYEARTRFDCFGPLEWAATEAEVATLSPPGNQSVLPFVEPRERPILYLDVVPYAWVVRGPDWGGGVFLGARRNEHFMLQIALVAPSGTSGFSLRRSGCIFSDLVSHHKNSTDKDATLLISASHISTPNLGGYSSRGEKFVRMMNVSGNNNGVLWVAVEVPSSAVAANYSGSVTLTLEMHTEALPMQQVITLPLTVEVVAGPAAEAHGDLNASSLSRSRWLDSTVGIDTQPTERFGALIVDDRSRTIRTGTGCQVVLDAASGLPLSVRSATDQYGDLLASAMRFEVVDTSGEVFTAISTNLSYKQADLQWNITDSIVQWTSASQSLVDSQGVPSNLRLSLSGSMEFDGALYYNITLRNGGGSVVHVDDVQLSLTVRAAAAPYVMGMGVQGGYSHRLHERPIAWRWSVDPTHLVRSNQVWLGDPGLGLRLKLLPNGIEYDSGDYWVDRANIPTYSWAGPPGESVPYTFTGLHFNRTLYSGGANVSYDVTNRTISTVVYTGEKLLSPSSNAMFRFQLLVTPSHPPNVSSHFRQKYRQVGSPTPSPKGKFDAKWAESLVDEKMAGKGYTIMNLHQGTQPLNPYTNWPLAPDIVPLQSELAKILHRLNMKLKVYFTVGMISTHIEILALLRSLGGEVLDRCNSANSEHPRDNDASEAGTCNTDAAKRSYSYTHPGGYAWVQEHLGTGYVGATTICSRCRMTVRIHFVAYVITDAGANLDTDAWTTIHRRRGSEHQRHSK